MVLRAGLSVVIHRVAAGAISVLRVVFVLLLSLHLMMACHATAATQPLGFADVLAAFDSQPVDSERQAELKRQAAAAVDGDEQDSRKLAQAYWSRARASGALGLIRPQIADMAKVVELGGADNPGRAWRELGQAELLGGNISAAINARLKAVQTTPANMRGRLLSEYAGLADLYRRIGDFESARRYVRDCESLFVVLRSGRNWSEMQYNWQATVEDALGRIEFASGHYAESEARFRKAMELVDKDLPLNLTRSSRGFEGAPQFQLEYWRDGLEAWLAGALLKQGKLYEAEIHARNAAYQSIRRGGQDSVQANANTQQFIQVLLEQDKMRPALQLVERIDATFERQKLPSEAFFVVRNQKLRANILAGLGRWKEAVTLYERIQSSLANNSELSATLGGASLGWVRALIGDGQSGVAAEMAAQLHAQLLKNLGADAYETREALGYWGVALARAGKAELGLQKMRDSIATLIPQATGQVDRSTRRFRRLEFIIEAYLGALGRMHAQAVDVTGRQKLAIEAFVVADALRGQAVQQAMAASAARAAASSPDLAQLVREEQDKRQERDALLAVLADLMSRRADQIPSGIIQEMRRRSGELDTRLRLLNEEIQRRFPDYAALMIPKPASLPQLQGVLHKGETLVSILSGEEQTYIWGIPAKGEISFAIAPLGKEQLRQQVGKLRQALDPGDVDMAKLPMFDAAVAHQLYQQLLEPVRPAWGESGHLIVAAGDALARLPFGVLLTALPEQQKSPLLFGDYKNWPWFIRDRAISQLPAANSLLTLRRMRAGKVERLAFAGFGDPDFGSQSGAQTRRVRPLLRAMAATETRAVDYSRIPALPDTRDEILALADALGADPARDIFLGKEASKSSVMQTALANRKVLAFATHGLLAGEYPGVEQPALALANPGNGQHGLLTLDDILGLKLDADWVILSACNTAAGDGQGGEAISGLGRGFFYAGTRALLVTHWPVETVSAKQLVVGVFRHLRQMPTLSRAKALQHSMLDVMAQQGQDEGLRFSYAHPMFWAPYALVGDGGR